MGEVEIGASEMSETVRVRRLRADLVYAAFDIVMANGGALIRLGLIPALGAFLGSCFAALFYPGAEIGQILYGVAGIIFAVGFHGIILEDDRPGWIAFRFRDRELAYAALVLLYILAASLAKLLSKLFVWLLGSPARIIVGGLFVWVVLRLVLMFPHAAKTGEISFNPSWDAMKGNIWRLLATPGFWPPPTARNAFFVLGSIMIVFGVPGSVMSGPIKLLFQAIAGAPAIAIVTAISSLMYKDLVSSTADEGSAAP